MDYDRRVGTLAWKVQREKPKPHGSRDRWITEPRRLVQARAQYTRRGPRIRWMETWRGEIATTLE